MIPSDPIMLLSFVNLKLRDYYGSLDAMCEDLDVSKVEITAKLAAVNYHYDAEYMPGKRRGENAMQSKLGCMAFFQYTCQL